MILFFVQACFTIYAINVSNRFNFYGRVCYIFFSILGEFYLKGKIRYAFRSNLFYYGTLLLIFGVLVIYVAVNYNLDASNFKVKYKYFEFKFDLK
jgi:hypothetical protein